MDTYFFLFNNAIVAVFYELYSFYANDFLSLDKPLYLWNNQNVLVVAQAVKAEIVKAVLVRTAPVQIVESVKTHNFSNCLYFFLFVGFPA